MNNETNELGNAIVAHCVRRRSELLGQSLPVASVAPAGSREEMLQQFAREVEDPIGTAVAAHCRKRGAELVASAKVR